MDAPTLPDRTRTRRWLIRGGIAALGLVVLWLGGTFALGTLLDPDRLAGWLEPRLSNALRRQVTVGSAGVRFFPLGFRLTDMAVADPTGLAPFLARVDDVGLDVQVLPLLRREVVIDRISLDRPSLDVRVGLDGVSNFETPTDSTEHASVGVAPFTLDVRVLRITSGNAAYARTLDSLAVRVDEIEASSAVRRRAGGPWELSVGSGARLTVVTPSARRVGPYPVELSVDADAAGDFTEVTLREGRVGTDGFGLALAGRAWALTDSIRQVDATAELDGLLLSRVSDALPDSLWSGFGEVGGTMSASLRVRGGFRPGMFPTATGAIEVRDGLLTAASGGLLARQVDMSIHLRDDGSLRPRLSGEVLGGNTTVDGEMTLGTEGAARLSVAANPDLSRLADLLTLPEGASLAGRLSADLRLHVPLAAPKDATGEGGVTVDGLRARAAALAVPVQIASASAEITGRRLIAQAVPFDLGSERLTVDVELLDPTAMGDSARVPHVAATVVGSKLTLPALSSAPAPDTALTYGRVAFARLGGRRVLGRSPEAAARELRLRRPDRLPVGGTIRIAIDTLIDRLGPSENVRATIEVGPEFVRVVEATFGRYGGRMTVGMNMSLGPSQAEPFTMRMRAEGVDATAFLGATTPLGRTVRGSFTTDADFAGSLDSLLLPTPASLVGGGRFDLLEGGLRPNPITDRLAAFLNIAELREPTIRRWSTPFTFESGAVRLAESGIQGMFGSPRASGLIGFDGRLDLRATMDLPRARLDQATIDRLGGAGAVAARALERADLSRADLTIRGSVSSPELGVVVGQTSLPRAVQDEAAREIREQIQTRREELEERAAGTIRDLLRRRLPTRPDTVRAPPPRPDTIPPDSASLSG